MTESTTLESSSIRWGTRTIEYGIRRSPRRKTVAVTVDETCGVLLTAPRDTPVGRLDAVVRDRASWIVGKLRLVDEQNRPRSRREWVSGESILYLGRHYRLRVEVRARPKAARLDRGRLVVQVDRGLGPAPVERAEAVSEAVEGWYRGHAEARLNERVELWGERLGGLEPEQVLVPRRAPTKRWGSCDREGTLRFSWRVIQAPMRLVDYIVAHELVHLVHRDHTSVFWTRLEEVLPDYAERREALRRLGPELEW